MLGFSRSKQADNTALLIGSFLLVSRWLFNDLSGFVFDLILLEFSTGIDEHSEDGVLSMTFVRTTNNEFDPHCRDSTSSA